MNTAASAGAVPRISARLDGLFSEGGAGPALQADGAWYGWDELQAFRVALDAAIEGVAPGFPAVGVLMRTTFGPVAAELALVAGGRTIHPLNPAAGDDQLAADVRDADVPVVLAEPREWERRALADACSRSEKAGFALLDRAPWIDVVVPGSAVAPTPARPATAVRMLTSGTTGPPKRVAITYAELDNMMDAVSHYASGSAKATDRPRSPALVSAPTVHSSGFGGVLRAAYAGRPIVLLERFSPEPWAAIIEEHGLKYTGLPPTALRMVLDAEIAPSRLRTLRAVGVGTAALDPDLADRFEAAYGIPVLPAYGATEFPGGLAGWTIGDRAEFWESKRGSVGRAHPGVRLKIVDPDQPDRDLAEGVGLLAAVTPTSPGDGFTVTNDLASIDDDGFLFIHGRADDAIIRGGFKIVPQELERLLEQHPGVVAAGVIGLPDERLGAVPAAVVETTEPIDDEELAAWLRDRLAAYQVPARVVVVDQLPRTPSMKVSKPALRALLDQS